MPDHAFLLIMSSSISINLPPYAELLAAFDDSGVRTRAAQRVLYPFDHYLTAKAIPALGS